MLVEPALLNCGDQTPFRVSLVDLFAPVAQVQRR
jgi:hypothetical protein